MTGQLFPRPPKRLRQPRKDVLREQLRLAADTTIAAQRRIAELEAENESLRARPSWLARLFRRTP